MRAADAMPPLDPFALPVETRGRFFMLATAALVAAWSLPSYFIEVPAFWTYLDGISLEDQKKLVEFTFEGISQLDQESMDWLVELGERYPQAHLLFWSQILRALCAFGVAVSAVVLTLAIAWFRRPERRPLLVQQAPTVHAEFQHLKQRLGLARMPDLAVKQGVLDGEAKGGRTGPLIVLAGDPRWLDRLWGDLHRAVLLHELGHLVNRDFRIRTFVRWLWIVVMGFALLTAVLLFSGGQYSKLGSLVMRFGLLGITAWLLWASLVRDRELYADQRVVSWGMGPSLFRRLSLAEAFEPDRDEGPSRWHSKLRRFLRGSHHPTHAERLQALNSPQLFFKLSLALAIHTGLLLSMSIATMGPLALDFLLPIGFLGTALVFLPFGVLALPIIVILAFSTLFFALIYWLSGALGIQVLRGAISGRIWGLSPLGQLLALAWPSCFLVAGFYIGLLPWMGRTSLEPIEPRFLVASVAAAWAWLALTYAMGRWILGATTRKRSQMLIWASRFVSAVLLLSLCWPLILHWSFEAIIRVAGGTGLSQDAHSFLRILFAVLISLLVIVACIGYLGLARILLGTSHFSCERCGDYSPYRLGVEASCPACGVAAASWPYRRIFDPWLGYRSMAEPKA